MYHFICRHRNDGLYDFVLFVRCSKQEISERAVQHRKFWCFNVPVVHFNLLFLLLFGTFWRTLGTSRTPDQKFANPWFPRYCLLAFCHSLNPPTPHTTRPCLHWDAPSEQEPKVVSWRMHRRRPKKLKRRPKKLNRHHVALPPEPNPPQLSVRLSPRNPRLDITLYHRSIVHCWKRLLLNTNTFHPQKAYANNCIWSNSGTVLLKRTPNGWHRTLWRFSVTCVRWRVLLWHFISTVHFPTGIGWSPRLCCVRIKRPMDRTGHKRDAYGVVQPWVNCLTTG